MSLEEEYYNDEHKKQQEYIKKQQEYIKNEVRSKIDVLQVWNEVQKTLDDERRHKIESEKSRWKTIRIFVSSTFADFHTERDVLVKEVFPELREWCQKRCLNVVECDLRWGIPKDTSNCIILRICLDELEECEKTNVWPYFLNMTSMRVGWIPVKDELTPQIISDYNLIIGLSVTEMEIVQAAYRKKNPNSLFLCRDDSFIDQISDIEIRNEFFDIDDLKPIANKKLKMLRDKLYSRFDGDQIVKYSCKYIPGKKFPNSNRARLELDPSFRETVLKFFMKRIDEQYPLNDADTPLNQYKNELNQQDAFMQDKAGFFIGQEEIIKQIEDYLEDKSGKSDKPFILLGKSGMGKSTVMAKIIYDKKFGNKDAGASASVSSAPASSASASSASASSASASSSANPSDFVFFHFVGAVPNSNDLTSILRRLLYELTNYDIPEDVDQIYHAVNDLLRSRSERKIYIFIDALNQLRDEEKKNFNKIFSWLPTSLPSNVKCVLSMVADSPVYKMLKSLNKMECLEAVMTSMQPTTIWVLVDKYLMKNRKKLGDDQVRTFLKKVEKNPEEGSPLWTIVACDLLRVYGDFSVLDELIEKLPPKLEELLKFFIDKIYDDLEDQQLFLAVLCLLECSKNGMLEVELLEVLAMMDSKTVYDKECKGNKYQRPRLNFMRWALMYRRIKMFVRPFGESGEGRLNFYHRSMGEVVKKIYLPTKPEGMDVTWEKRCHSVLAVYFETSYNLDRIVEEYPHHIMYLEDRTRMRKFLLNSVVFDKLYDNEFSDKLLWYWRFIDVSYRCMGDAYMEDFEKLKETPGKVVGEDEIASKGDKLARLFNQAGLFKESFLLAKECLQIYESKEKYNETTKKEIMYLNGLLGSIEYRQSKHGNIHQAIKYREKSIEMYLRLSDPDDIKVKKYYALQLNSLAFLLQLKYESKWFSLNREKIRKRAISCCDQAIEIYDSVKDFSHKIDAQLTSADLQLDHKKTHEIYETCIEDYKKLFGPDYACIIRAANNNAILYEKDRNFKQAYKYFKIAYLLNKHLYGSEHVDTLRYKSYALDPNYNKIRKENKEDIENMVWSDDLV